MKKAPTTKKPSKKVLKISRKETKDEGGFRAKYEEGVDLYYTTNGAIYANPHESFLLDVIEGCVETWVKPLFAVEKIAKLKVLDLACGSGEASIAFRNQGISKITGCDPYTFEAYEKRTGLPVIRDAFVDIAKGSLGGEEYDIIVCSYALHLAPLSVLPQLCLNLALISEHLLIISPHKFPVMKVEYGWEIMDQKVEKRVHCRLFKSTLFSVSK